MNKPTEKAEINNFKPRGRPFRRVDDKPKLDPKIQLNKISKFYLDSPSDKYNTYDRTGSKREGEFQAVGGREQET